jgi:hypothetical protein
MDVIFPCNTEILSIFFATQQASFNNHSGAIFFDVSILQGGGDDVSSRSPPQAKSFFTTVPVRGGASGDF